MWQIENAVKDVLALDIDSGFRCKGGPCTCPIRINEQYRICFVWSDDGPLGVEIVDYH